MGDWKNGNNLSGKSCIAFKLNLNIRIGMSRVDTIVECFRNARKRFFRFDNRGEHLVAHGVLLGYKPCTTFFFYTLRYLIFILRGRCAVSL